MKIILNGGNMLNFFNILVRTSNRPNYFKYCIESIRCQIYDNYQIIISVDNNETLKYVKQYNVDKIIMNEYKHPSEIKNIPVGRRPAPWNSYFDKMLANTKKGFVIYIDDDDKFINNKSLKLLNESITEFNTFAMWQVLFPNDKLIPNNENFNKYKNNHKPIPAQISGIGICHSTLYNDKIKWTPYNFGDYRVATQLYNNTTIDNRVFIDIPLTTLQRLKANGMGRRDDL